MSRMLKEKRSTRGLRMTDLVGQAAEDDDAFWGDGIWNEEQSDDSFSEEEAKPDEFDSDFNDSESEEEEGSDDDAKEKKATRAAKVAESKRSNVYKDPSVGSKRSAPRNRTLTTKRKRSDNADLANDRASSTQLISTVRSLRDSTKSKTAHADRTLESREKTNKLKKPTRRPIPSRFVQKDLLAEALDTEEQNSKWLFSQRMLDDDRTQMEKKKQLLGASSGGTGEEGHRRFLSRRGTFNTITFTSVAALPAILCPEKQEVPVVPETRCVITGLPAKYRDPVTNQPYANLDAFKQLRQQRR
mmetsp:Transcript_29011/g.48741  ORF Transcript_29011/g.48741 Transcript_29011/m.48741 type:complete len:301 (-) Transcript_29011:2106-3008(-)